MPPKLRSLTAKQIIKLLKLRGFRLDHTTGSHYIFYRAIDRKRVTVPYHSKDLPKGTLLSILKQAGISKEEL